LIISGLDYKSEAMA